MLNLFEKKYDYVGLDIGSAGIKLIRLANSSEGSYELVDYGYYAMDADVFSQNVIKDVDTVAEKLRQIGLEHGLQERRIVTSVPAPSLFTKRQRVPRLPMQELREHIEYESANFIPHGADAVYLDFHILGLSGKNHVDVLVVAVKKEIVESYVSVFETANLKVGVVDVDQFALQNVFELNYGEIDETVALVNLGARCSGINICRGGKTIFAGDVSLGCNSLTEAIAEDLQISVSDAEREKIASTQPRVKELIADFVEHSASELSRQISYFWSASGSDGGIDQIVVTGGGAMVSGLVEALESEASTSASVLDVARAISFSDSLNKEKFHSQACHYAIATGLAMRACGDKLEIDDL